MNRRMFVAVGASAVVVSAGTDAAALGLATRPTLKGRRVTVAGRLRPAARGPGHFFVLEPRAGDGNALTQASDGLVVVYPLDLAAMRTGPVRLEGWLYQGRFKDEVTGHVAGAALTEARLV